MLFILQFSSWLQLNKLITTIAVETLPPLTTRYKPDNYIGIALLIQSMFIIASLL